MTSSAESITESLRRTRQLMVQVITIFLLFLFAWLKIFVLFLFFFLMYLCMSFLCCITLLLLLSFVICLQEVERSASTLMTVGKYLSMIMNAIQSCHDMSLLSVYFILFHPDDVFLVFSSSFAIYSVVVTIRTSILK